MYDWYEGNFCGPASSFDADKKAAGLQLSIRAINVRKKLATAHAQNPLRIV
jgi:hypothetical protein